MFGQGSPFQQNPGQPTQWDASGGGPLQGLDSQLAGVLNASDQNNYYIPAGSAGLVTVPRPRPQRVYRPYTSQHRVPGSFALRAGLGLAFAVTVVVGAVAGVAALVFTLIH